MKKIMVFLLIITLTLLTSAQISIDNTKFYNNEKIINFDTQIKGDETLLGNYVTYYKDIVTPIYIREYYYEGFRITQDLVDRYFEGNLIVDKKTLDKIEIIETNKFSHYEYNLTEVTEFHVDFVCNYDYLNNKKEWTIEELAIEKISERRCR